MEKILLVFATGLLAGVVFFGGLWWTVRLVGRVAKSRLFLLASFGVRTAMVFFGGLATCGEDLANIMAYMAGMLVVRTIILQRVSLLPSAKPKRGADG